MLGDDISLTSSRERLSDDSSDHTSFLFFLLFILKKVEGERNKDTGEEGNMI